MAPVVLLAGGTGGAKLARGLLDELGPDLVVIANTGDDVEIYGAHVSPDPDLITFWLADAIDERGWGIKDDTFAAMDQLRALGEQIWFNLGDRDLAIGLHRAQRLAAGGRLTHAIDELRRAFDVPARVLVPTDTPLRTFIRSGGNWHAFQEFMIRIKGPLEDVEYRAAAAPVPTPEALDAIREARAIIIGPSNPVLSIDPIVAVLGDALHAADAPVVAVSPLVRGQVLKGPTADCLTWAGQTLDSDGIADHYGALIDGLVADQRTDLVPTLETDVELGDPESRRRVAAAVLEFAAALA
ncbi:2-phospho-L-lactate transferase CofD family protein [Solirubrobacter taibaiensis]|nr:2-phospho-L-lactate transferase CofD family protein [Solirubrobacter taibaiensis]